MAENRIEAALERARQRRKDDKRAESSRAAAAEQPSVPRQPMPRFPQLAIDTEGCVARRILISEHGYRWNAGADASYRMLRTRVLQRVRSNRWTTIGVTSPSQGDGKSLTTLNLALSIAREGNSNVFLLDLPPILATDDALVVAPMIDACLLVVSEGRSRRDSAAEAIALLSEFTLAGIVLNRSRAAIKDYHYSYS